MRRLLTLGFIVLLASIASACVMPKYKVVTKTARHTDFSRLTTYVWESGGIAYDQVTHEQIVAAVDRELAARGFTKRNESPSDVTVAYTVLRRSDADLASKMRGPDGERPRYPVSTLLVLIRTPGTLEELFRARADRRIPMDPRAIEMTIDDQVARMFEHFPRKARRE
jgi:hypothetical protein